ncbi:hypothetical protein [Mycolicibacterium porcinum]|uniref:hypothetical protein n=1 Tax=Mycolicibacterium porcinum TaxID=39693 RepID=UPI001041CE64|nr:hypothetical protein [Mycolicibacterium porcinum]
MNDQEFFATPVGKSVLSFLRYMDDLKAIMNQADLSRAAMFGIINVFKKEPIDRSRHDAFIHALYLVGAWGAFEAFFDDFVVAILKTEPDILDEERIKDIKVPISDLLAEGDDKTMRVYKAIKDKSEARDGVARFEAILKAVQLSAAVPDPIKDAIHESRQIRHVWAHKAGVADEKFLKVTSQLGFSLGDQVAISNEQARTYVVGIFLYGSIIFNRWRIRLGLNPIISKAEEDHPLMQAYQTLYTDYQTTPQPQTPIVGWWAETPEQAAEAKQTRGWTTKRPTFTADSAPDTSPSASDAPPESPVPPSAEEPQVQTSSPDSAQDPTQ